MTSLVKFPIQGKLVLVIGALLLGSSIAYLALGIKIFEQDKKQLVLELNASTVKTMAAQVEAFFAKYFDKAHLLAQGHKESAWVKSVLFSDPDLVAFSLFQRKSNWEVISQYEKSDYLERFSVSGDELQKVRKNIPIPFDEILKRKTLVWNSTLPNQAPLISLASAIDAKILVVDIKPEKLLELFEGNESLITYLIDYQGFVLVHADKKMMEERTDLTGEEIVIAALKSPVKFQIYNYTSKESQWLGAFGSVGLGSAMMISQISQKIAYSGTYRFIEKSILFAGIILTITVLISIWLSKGLTRPLRHLVEATQRLADWDYREKEVIQTNDEIGELARAFDVMASQVQKQHREVEIKVKERTSELEHQKSMLAEAQDTLLKTTRLASLGELAGAAAHEILNPVNNINIRLERLRTGLQNLESTQDLVLGSKIIQGWSETYKKTGWEGLKAELSREVQKNKPLFQEDVENLEEIFSDLKKTRSEEKEAIDFISSEILRISKMVNNMRALSRVGGERRSVDIHQPLDKTLLAYSDHFDKKNVHIVKEFSIQSREHFFITADPDELVQVYSNLIRNALQAIESAARRQGEIIVTTQHAQSRIEIRFKDNGTGIPEEHLAKVFEPSFTTKSIEQGTGLGLAISRRIVRAFGGDVEVEKTKMGFGSTFLIWFPTA